MREWATLPTFYPGKYEKEEPQQFITLKDFSQLTRILVARLKYQKHSNFSFMR